MRSKIPKQSHDIFRQLAPTEHFLKKLESVNFNLFDPSLGRRYDLLAWNIQKKKWKGTF